MEFLIVEMGIHSTLYVDEMRREEEIRRVISNYIQIPTYTYNY